MLLTRFLWFSSPLSRPIPTAFRGVTAYERSHPVVDHELSVDAPMYLVVGGAGNREGHAGKDGRPCPQSAKCASAYSAVHDLVRTFVFEGR